MVTARFRVASCALALALGGSIPLFIYANGGDQRIVEGLYLVSLSRSPFTPRAGERVEMLVSFADAQSNELLAGDLLVNVRIVKLADSAGQQTVFERSGITVQGGILELSYTFTAVGLHEVFVDFAFVAQPQTVYRAPDFLLDVQEVRQPATVLPLALGSVAGVMVGIAVGFFVRRSAGV